MGLVHIDFLFLLLNSFQNARKINFSLVKILISHNWPEYLEVQLHLKPINPSDSMFSH